MEGLEPAQPNTSPEHTSLELTFEPDTVPATVEPPAPGLLGNLVVARFRHLDTAMLGRVLISTLSESLPASMVRVERPRSMGRRLARRTAEPIGITISAGDRTLSFRAPEDGVTEARVGHTVRGVVLSSTPVPIAQWLDELGAVLDQLQRDDDATRVALERVLLT